MMNYWCLLKEITNLSEPRVSIRVDVKWLYTRFRTSPPPTIDFDPELSVSTAAARAALCEEHWNIVDSLRMGVDALFYCCNPLHSSDKERNRQLKRLVKDQTKRLMVAMERYGEDVLLPLHEAGMKTELQSVLKTEFSVVMTTVCLLYEIYGLKETAAALEENQKWLEYTKVVRQNFTIGEVQPDQILLRLKEKFPHIKWPDSAEDLGRQASVEPQGTKIGREHQRLGRKQESWPSDDDDDKRELDDEETPKTEEPSPPVVRYDEETGIELFPPDPDDDIDCPAEWDMDYYQGLGPFVLDCGQQLAR